VHYNAQRHWHIYCYISLYQVAWRHYKETYIGYTHYWTFKQPSKVKGNAAKAETKYLQAIGECQRVVKAFYKENGGISGFSAHTKLGQYGGLEFNGKQELSHEPFVLREHFRQNFEGHFDGFNFCKTAQKPYDTLVVACLAILKYRLGDLVEVSSDGRASDWDEGVLYAQTVLGLKIENPILLEEEIETNVVSI
jgi:hypothetical protein